MIQSTVDKNTTILTKLMLHMTQSIVGCSVAVESSWDYSDLLEDCANLYAFTIEQYNMHW